MNQFQLPTSFVATYRVTATGSNGQTATTTFTDGNLRFSYAPSAVGNFSDSWTKYTNSTCTTAGGSAPTSGSGTVTNSPGTTLSAGALANEWIKITAPSTVGSYAFSSWTGPGTFSSTNATICVPGFAGSGNDSYVMNFTLVTVQPTSLSVSAASGTYGGTVSLSATLTSGGSGVAGKSISFMLNGASAGSATTNGSGVATLSGVSLSGINAGTYNPGVNSGVAASFAGDSGYSASSGSSTLTIAQAASTTTVTCPASVPYNGSAQTPCSATVTGAGGLSLTPTPSYSNNTNAGTATASYTYARRHEPHGQQRLQELHDRPGSIDYDGDLPGERALQRLRADAVLRDRHRCRRTQPDADAELLEQHERRHCDGVVHLRRRHEPHGQQRLQELHDRPRRPGLLDQRLRRDLQRQPAHGERFLQGRRRRRALRARPDRDDPHRRRRLPERSLVVRADDQLQRGLEHGRTTTSTAPTRTARSAATT